MFYGAPKSRTPSPPREGSGSGSEAETEIEEPVKRFKRLHRRLDSIDSVSSHSEERQERKRSKTSLQKVSARDTHGRQPLQRACARGDFERIEALVKEGADILDRDYAGTTALHSAALQGDPQIVEFLLKNGAIADVRSGPDELDTPLMDAVSSSNLPVIKLLIKYGADPRVQNAEGKTTVDFIDEDAEEADEIHELLKRESLKARQKGPPIQDPADAPKRMFPPQVKSAKKNGVERALDMAGSRARRRNDLLWFDVTTKTGRMEVCKRAAQGDVEYIGMSLEHGWQPSAEALVQAAKFGHTDIVGLLLAFGKSPDDLHEGRTALHETVGRGHLEVVKLLVEGGADPTWRDESGLGYADLVKDLPADDEERLYIEQLCGSTPIKEEARTKLNEKETKPKEPKVKEPKDKEPKVTEPKSSEPKPKQEEPSIQKAKEELDSKDTKQDPPKDKGPVKEAETKPAAEKPPLNVDTKRSERDGQSPKDTRSKDEVVAPVPRKLKESRVRFDENLETEKRDRKSLDRVSQSVSPRSTPPPQQSQEDIKRLQELAAKRERDRKAREAEMLSALEQQEKRAAERRERLSGEFESRVTSPVVSAVASPSTIPSPGPETPTAQLEEAAQASSPGRGVEVPFSQVSGLPYALQVLSVLGTPQPVQPLLVCKKNGQDYVLDVQLALFLGAARLHEDNPDLTKVPVGNDQASLWGLAFTWMAPKRASTELLASEKSKFESLKLNWIPLSEATKVAGTQQFETVRICLQAPKQAGLSRNPSYDNVPLRLIAQMSANRAASQWP